MRNACKNTIKKLLKTANYEDGVGFYFPKKYSINLFYTPKNLTLPECILKVSKGKCSPKWIGIMEKYVKG